MTDESPDAPPVAKRSLGQNFLIDPNLQRKIVEALDPRADDEILEIGPGTGALTRHLVGRVRRLVLVELDSGLAARIRTQFADPANVVILEQDILTIQLRDVLQDATRAKIIGNIPYNITTPIIFHLLQDRRRPARIVLMVQREVADRIVARPGNKTYGALAVGVQALAQARRLFTVGRQAFRPVPDVESSVIELVPHPPGRLSPELEAALRSLTRIAFSWRRKQLQRILRDALGLGDPELDQLAATTGFDLTARPETFSPDEFLTLARVLRLYLPA